MSVRPFGMMGLAENRNGSAMRGRFCVFGVWLLTVSGWCYYFVMFQKVFVFLQRQKLIMLKRNKLMIVKQ